METKLKDAIIKRVQEHEKESQLVNNTTDTFREYIYDSKGEYLIGGEKVAEFIQNFIKLYVTN